MSCTSIIELASLVISLGALRAVLRLFVLGGATALHVCRVWQIVVGATLAALLVLGDRVDPVVLLMVATAALDCWLVTHRAPSECLPRAIIRERDRRGGR